MKQALEALAGRCPRPARAVRPPLLQGRSAAAAQPRPALPAAPTRSSRSRTTSATWGRCWTCRIRAPHRAARGLHARCKLLPRLRGRAASAASPARSPAQPLQPADEQFLTQLAAISRSAAATLDDPAAYRNPWGSLDRPAAASRRTCSPSRSTSSAATARLAFLLVRPVKEAGSFTAALKQRRGHARHRRRGPRRLSRTSSSA